MKIVKIAKPPPGYNSMSERELAMVSKYLAKDPIEPRNENHYLDLYTLSTGPHTIIFHGRQAKSKTEVLVKIWWPMKDKIMVEPERLVEKFCAALENWKRAFAHHGICNFLGLVEGFGGGYLPSLVLPKYVNGNATDYFKNHPLMDRYPAIVDIADALRFLHQQSPPIVHGMLYGQSIVISDSGRPLLTDIGTSDLEYSFSDIAPGKYRPYQYPQRVRWMASDILAPGIAEADLGLTGDLLRRPRSSSDVYSFGMTVLELTTGRIPFCHFKHVIQVGRAVERGDRPVYEECPEVASEELWKVLEECWQQLPSKRPTMEAVYSQLVSLRR